MFTCTHAFLISRALSFFFFWNTYFQPFFQGAISICIPHWIVSIMQVGSAWVPTFVACSNFENSYSLFSLLVVVLECLAWLSRVWEARHYILILWVRLASDEPLFSSHVFIAYIPSDIWFHPLFDCMALHFFPQLFKAQFCKLGGINMLTTIHNTTHTQTAKYLICYNMKNCNQIYIQH